LLTEEIKQEMMISLLGLGKNECETKQVASCMIGKVCMFRTYSAGVHFGELVDRDGKECLLKDSRRVFYWDEACSLSQLAIEGSKKIDKCKIAMEIPELFLSEVIEIIPMSYEAKKQLKESPVWKK